MDIYDSFFVIAIYIFYYFNGHYPLEFIFFNFDEFFNFDKFAFGMVWGSIMECAIVFVIAGLPIGILDTIYRKKIFKYLDTKIPRSYDYVPDHEL